MPAVTVPPQLVLGAPATTVPVGKVSVKGALRLAAVEKVLLKVMVRVDAPPALMVGGLNAFPTVTAGGADVTGVAVKVAKAGDTLFP